MQVWVIDMAAKEAESWLRLLLFNELASVISVFSADSPVLVTIFTDNTKVG